MDKLYLHYPSTMAQDERDKMQDELNAMVQATHNAACEMCAVVAASWADHYPLDVFPEGTGTVDSISASAMRHAAKQIAAAIRARGEGNK